MSETYISAPLRRQVEERARFCCEYCLLPAKIAFFSHEIDHVIAEKHGGRTELENLAFTCWRCNRYKGTDLGSFDPLTGEFSFLFNPRSQEWSEHFCCEEFHIIGLTPIGRTTVKLLRLNNEERLAERRRLDDLQGKNI
jgi:hypothetical protein